MDDTNADAGSQSDEQDLEITIPDSEEQEASQDQEEKEDPSDKLTPDHPRFKTVLEERNQFRAQTEELRNEIDKLKQNASNRQLATGDDELTPEEVSSLNKIKRELAKDGFVTKTDLQVNQNAQSLKELSSSHNGRDGLPKFEAVDVVAYAKKNGFNDNYEAAYKDMHFDTIVEHNAKARAKSLNSPSSEKPSGGAENSGGKRFTESDIANMSDTEYEKYRTGLLTAIKPK